MQPPDIGRRRPISILRQARDIDRYAEDKLFRNTVLKLLTNSPA
jgi:hypothetical protein